MAATLVRVFASCRPIAVASQAWIWVNAVVDFPPETTQPACDNPAETLEPPHLRRARRMQMWALLGCFPSIGAAAILVLGSMNNAAKAEPAPNWEARLAAMPLEGWIAFALLTAHAWLVWRAWDCRSATSTSDAPKR